MMTPLVVMMLALLSLTPSLISASREDPSEPLKPYLPVPRVVWREDADFAEEFVKRGDLVVLTGTIVNQWTALKKWNAAYMTNKLSGQTFKAKVSKEKWFYTSCCEAHTMPVEEFFSRASLSSTTHEYMYYSAPLTSLGGRLVRDLKPLDKLYVRETRGAAVGDQAWLGSAGASTLMHYDALHNYYVQLHGRKRFILAPVSDWNKLCLFPKHHIQHRNIQPFILEPDMEVFPHLAQVNLYEVVLEPGEVLYLPPGWFHFVQAVDFSISVNLWSASRDIEILDDLWDLPFPLDFENWSRGQLATVVGSYLTKVVDDFFLNNRTASREFLDCILMSYNTAYNRTLNPEPFHRMTDSPFNPDTARFKAYEEAVAAYTAAFDSMPGTHSGIAQAGESASAQGRGAVDFALLTVSGSECSNYPQPSSPSLAWDSMTFMNDQTRQALDDTRKKAVKGFQSVADGLGSLYLFNYIDDLVGLTLGDVTTHYFLRCTLAPPAEG